MPNTSRKSKVIFRPLLMLRKLKVKPRHISSPFMLMKMVSKSQKDLRVKKIKLLSHPSLDTMTLRQMLSQKLMEQQKVPKQLSSLTPDKLMMVMKVFLIKLLNSLLVLMINQPKLLLVLFPPLKSSQLRGINQLLVKEHHESC